MDDVAREAGVSRALVSLVMRDSPKVSPHRRERVLRRGGAARLPPQRDRAQPRQPPHAHRRRAAQRPAQPVLRRDRERHRGATRPSIGYRLLIITGGRREQRERAMLEALLEYRTDGLILVSPRLAGAADRGRGRLGAVRRHRPARCATGASTAVMTDEALGARLARRAPRRSSATSASSTSTAAAARAPRRAAPATSRRWPRPASRRARGSSPASSPRTRARAAAERAAARPATLPTAVFAANDLVAIGLIDRLEQRRRPRARGRLGRRLRQHVRRRPSATSA